MFRIPDITKSALAMLALLLAIGAAGWKCYDRLMIPDDPHHATHVALGDFRDVIYYPTRAVLSGINPYDAGREGDPGPYRKTFPVGNHFPPYSPLIFFVGLPFAGLPLLTGAFAWWLVNVGLTVLLTYVAWRWCGCRPTVAMTALLAAVIVFSRPGRANLISGQATLIFVLASLAALHWARSRPLSSGLALAVATIKPTFGLPLAMLMLARRDWKAAITGLSIGGLAFAIGGALIFGHGAVDGSMLAVLRDNQSLTNREPTFDPEVTSSRIDLPFVAERLLGPAAAPFSRQALPLLVLGVACLVLWRITPQFPTTVSSSRASYEEDRLAARDRLAATLSLATVTVCIYHNVYDALLLAAPALLACPWVQSRPLLNSRWQNAALFMFLVLPALSYFSSRSVGLLLDQFLASRGVAASLAEAIETALAVTNGVALSAAWIILLVAAIKSPHSSSEMASRMKTDLPENQSITQLRRMPTSPRGAASSSGADREILV